MNKLFFFFAVTLALLLTGHFSPLAAQYNPPPPPDQSAGGPPDGGPSAPPSQEAYNGGEPGPDQGPPPDGSAPDNGAPSDGGGDTGDANFQTFYDNLSSQGNWVQTDNYGYVWQPNVEDQDWRPYSDGHWVYTDEGWTWVAGEREPWGWATYHYGRWANLDGYGWVWVPGYTWAPAWVSWRYGGGYCGWAPLPPVTFVGIDFGGVGLGFHIGGDCDRAYGIGPGYYNFIAVGDIGERDYRRHYIDRNNNFTIINNTRNVTNIIVNNQRGSGRFSRVSVGGPNFSTINAQSHSPVQRAHLARSGRIGAASLNGNQLAVFAPHVRPVTGTNVRPSRVAATVGNARVNPGASISQPLQVNARVKPRGASEAQIAAAQNVHFSSAANVATPGTHPAASLERPLTSYQPHEARHATTPGGTAPITPTNRAFNPAATSPGTHQNAFTGENATETRRADTGAVNNAVNHDEATVHHAAQSEVTPQVQRTVTPQVQQEERHPQPQAQEEERHPQPQIQHEETHVQPQAQHEDFRPQPQHEETHGPVERHDAPPPPPQHANAPAPPGNGGGHPSGGNGKKDDKQQQ